MYFRMCARALVRYRAIASALDEWWCTRRTGGGSGHLGARGITRSRWSL